MAEDCLIWRNNRLEDLFRVASQLLLRQRFAETPGCSTSFVRRRQHLPTTPPMVPARTTAIVSKTCRAQPFQGSVGRNHDSHQARQALMQGLPPRSIPHASSSAFRPLTESTAESAGEKVVWTPRGRPSNPGSVAKLKGLRNSDQLRRMSPVPDWTISLQASGGDPSRWNVVEMTGTSVSLNGS